VNRLTPIYRMQFAAVLAACLAVAGCGQNPDVAKRDFVKNGDAYVAQGKLNEAAIEYRNAVQLDARYGEARFKLAQTALKIGDGNTAYRESIRAADLMPDDFEAQLQAGQVYLFAEQFDDARARAIKALALKPDSPAAHILRGNALAGLRDFDGAIAQVEEAIKSDPDGTLGYVDLGALQFVHGNTKEAEQAFSRAVGSDPASIPAKLALASFYWSDGKRDAAETQLKQALALDPKNVDVNRALAFLYIGLHRTGEAEAPLKLVASESKEGGARLMLADYYRGTDRADLALQTLDSVGSDSDVFTVARARKADLLYSTGRKVEAYSVLNDVLVKDAKNAPARLEKSQLLLADGKLEEALPLAQSVAVDNPRLVGAQLAVGRIRSARGENDEAIAAYNEALKLSPKLVPAWLDLARVQIASGHPDDGLRSAEGALAIQPRSADAVLLKARALLASGDAVHAEGPMRLMAANFPNSAAVQAQLGVWYALKHDLSAARASFERALKSDPKNMDALSGLIGVDLAQEKKAAARARADAAVAQAPDSPSALILAARTYAAVGEPAAQERALRRTIEVAPSNLEAYSMLGRLFAEQRRVPEALAEFDQLTKRKPDSVPAQTVVGILYEIEGNRLEAKKRYEKTLAIDRRAAVASNNLAMIYVDSGDNLDVALQLAQAAKAQLPDVPEINDTLGWIYCKKGLGSLAIPPLQQSIAKDPNNRGYLAHLGMAYAKTGQLEKAKDALGKALARGQNFPDAAEAKSTLAALSKRSQ
jgi:tetratricopeptide (TPR) repeat protein